MQLLWRVVAHHSIKALERSGNGLGLGDRHLWVLRGDYVVELVADTAISVHHVGACLASC